MTLGLYLVRRLAGSFGLIAAVFLGVLYLFEVIEMVRRFGGEEVGLGHILWLAMLRVPRTFYQILPLLMILSSMSMFLTMARSSELVVIRAAGRSALRMMVEPLLATLVFAALMVAVLNPVAAAAARIYQAQVQQLQNPDLAEQISLTDSAIWLRQGDSIGQSVIRAEGVEGDGLTFRRISFLIFDRESGAPLSRIEADTGRLEPGAWVLDQAKRWDLFDDNPEREAEVTPALRLPTDLTPERIRDSFARAGTISIWSLSAFIAALERAGLSTIEYRAQMQSELALPILMAAMMMIGAVFCLTHARAGNAGLRILVAVLAGFALFFLRNFAQVLGVTGQIPLSLAIWTPPIASILLALGILLHLEDG